MLCYKQASKQSSVWCQMRNLGNGEKGRRHSRAHGICVKRHHLLFSAWRLGIAVDSASLGSRRLSVGLPILRASRRHLGVQDIPAKIRSCGLPLDAQPGSDLRNTVRLNLADPFNSRSTTASITHLLIWNFWSLRNCMSLGTSERAAAQLCKAWPATSTGSIWGVNVEVAGKNSLEDDAGICVKTSALSLRVQNTQLNVNPRNSLISPARS